MLDVSGLPNGMGLHFDLYNETVKNLDIVDIDVKDFAPFSHDAEYVPEAGQQ